MEWVKGRHFEYQRTGRSRVKEKRTLVRLGDGVIRVVGALSTSDDVSPPCSDTGASGDVDDVVVLVLEVVVTRHTSVIDVLDRL